MCLAGSQPQKWKERIRLARFPRASRTENKEIASIHKKWHIFQNMIIALKVERQTAKDLCLPLKLDVIGGNLRWNETGRTITLQSNFQLSVKVIKDCFGLTLLHFVIGLENSCHSHNQSNAN